MAESMTERLKREALEKGSTKAGAQPTPTPPRDGGSMSGERLDPRGEGSKDRDVASGPKSLPEKSKMAEEKTAKAKAEDQEDTREETSGDERHDLVAGKELNIPPSIVSERLRNGQNPSTGESWTRAERMAFDKATEQARQEHRAAVREAELTARKEEAEAKAPATPAAHVPRSFLTDRQVEAMQESQDRGEGPYAQAAARDRNHPDELGKAEGERRMAKSQEKSQVKDQDDNRLDSGFDKDVVESDREKAEGERAEDADEVEKSLEEHASRK
jgi:hypothetical protein